MKIAKWAKITLANLLVIVLLIAGLFWYYMIFIAIPREEEIARTGKVIQSHVQK